MPTPAPPTPSLQWGSEALWRQLEPLLPGLSVEVVASTPSTNTALLDRARGLPERHTLGGTPTDTAIDGDGAPQVLVRRSVESGAFGRRAVDLQTCLLVAEHQSAGRGRQGRSWQSAAGASLTFSLALPLTMADWSGLSLAVGVALCEALDPDPLPAAAGTLVRPRLGLKWPNDLWLMDADGHGRKLGGVLIETVTAGAQRLAIVGVGLNVLRFDAGGVGTGFASLAELDATATAPRVLATLSQPLVQALLRFQRDGFAGFAQRFAARDVLRGRAVVTTQADAPEGMACGVSPQGALLVQTSAGLVSVCSGEVSVRPVAAPVA